MSEEKNIFIESIKADDNLVTVFLCQSKNTFVGKNGRAYMSLTLSDKTGSVDSKIWDSVDKFSALFEEDNFVKVKAIATSYNGKLQLKIQNIKAISDSEIDPGDFFATSKHDIEEMHTELREIMQAITDENIKELVFSFLDDKDFMADFLRAPAAKSIHHSFIGGLIEHTLSLCKLAKNISSHYDSVDYSLLLGGVFLHDIGKTKELEYTRSTGYTDVGRLLGHITIGVDIMNQKISTLPNFPEQTKMLLTHMILAHHGVLEFGSPKRPKIIEAHVLSVIDDLDARVNSFQEILDRDTKASRWSSYQRMYDRYLYRWQGDEILEDVETQAENADKTPNHSPTEKPKSSDGFSNSPRVSDTNNADKANKHNMSFAFGKNDK